MRPAEQFAWTEAALASNVRSSPCPWHVVQCHSLDAGLCLSCLTLLSPSSGARLEASKGGLGTLPSRLRGLLPQVLSGPRSCRESGSWVPAGVWVGPCPKGDRTPRPKPDARRGILERLRTREGQGRETPGRLGQESVWQPRAETAGGWRGPAWGRDSGFLGLAEQQSWTQRVTRATPPS